MSVGPAAAHGPTPTPTPTPPQSEARLIASHAGTMAVGQLAVMAFGVTDTLVAGRHSELSLAALSVGSATYISVFVAMMGMLQALMPVWSKLHGAGDTQAIGPSFRQAWYLAAAGALMGAAALLGAGPVLRVFSVPESVLQQVLPYLNVLALALPLGLAFRLGGTLCQAVGQPRWVTALQIGGLAVKVPLTVWLGLGGAGVPALGALGCAIATVVAYGLMMVGMWVVLRLDAALRPLRLLRWPGPPNTKALRAFVALGLPAGLAVLVEVTSFTLMALLIARMGPTAGAAHQVAANAAALMYMVPLSIAIACSARVGWGLGAQRPDRVMQALRAGAWAMGIWAVSVAVLLWSLRGVVAQLYTPIPAVQALAASLLAWVALYHAADAVQTLAAFVLRCWSVTVRPLAIFTLCLWTGGLGGGYLWAYGWPGQAPHSSTLPWALRSEPSSFWISAALALGGAAVLLVGLLLRVLRRWQRAEDTAHRTEA